MKIALFGLGYVGSVTAACLAHEGHEVTGIDVDAVKVDALNLGRSSVVETGLDDLISKSVSAGLLHATTSVREGMRDAEISLICVGTPSQHNGSTSLSQLESVVRDIGRCLHGRTSDHTVVIRSTVPPGTVEGVVTPILERMSGLTAGNTLHVAMCPEFLREGTGVADLYEPPFMVIGASSEREARPVRALFGFLDCQVHVSSIREAESLKYACNAFHAVKITFANEISRLYRDLDVDARQVMRIFVEDRRLNISPAYLRPGFAFGGSCLPKDLRSLLHMGRTRSIDLPLLSATLFSNEMSIRDVVSRVVELADTGDRANHRVALMGLSFKGKTDDLRESPNVELAEMLIGKGFDLRIHDPVIKPERVRGSNLRYVQDRIPHLRVLLTDTPESALDGARVAILADCEPDVRDAVVEAAPPAVIDLNGQLGAQVEQLEGYQGVGW